MSDDQRPIIIRRKKIIKKHHGGSWKIALADFMTALMALFLVMWILSISSEESKQQVADYFSTPLMVALTSGDKSSASTSAIKGGGDDPSHAKGEQMRIDLRRQTRPSDVRRHFQGLQERIKRAVEDDPVLRELADQLRFDITREGLRIQVVDSEQRPMFELGSDKVASYMDRLLRTLTPIINEVPNEITLSGHTDSLPYAGGERGYSNWELSADRANASRKVMLDAGLDTGKLLLVTGVADRIPMDGVESDDPMNRRITLVLHTQESAEFIKRQGYFPQDQAEYEALIRSQLEQEGNFTDQQPLK
ncbi:flagellar motor protein MotB [Pseudidiomarina salinarum]|uniref:Flagellar motor protein MotB n=1 Tax=Pseudidiomarina salinarum TaxID=435908 RepID=A0A094JED8_9GAMM|nr:flagellar motor protein MotB [Pseudidiomarina salinarum]KFZ30921.1 flagellar motor protein MotB [Pseudidiomarina salinarum]RUO71408.1 motility protein MotB [Pseudidiomarina salinarum]